MNHKNFIIFPLVGLCAVLHQSCVDDSYDLVNKDISTDIKITGNTVTVPLGSMKAVKLDDLIDVDDIDILKVGDNGLYALGTDDVIDPIEENIDPINISIDPVEELIDIEFTEAEITSVHISAANVDPAVFKTPNISLDDLNDKLPSLQSNVTREITSTELDAVFDVLESGNAAALPAEISLNQSVVIENENVDCSFNYTLPTEVKTINTILLTSADNKTTDGTLLNVVITHPQALHNADKSVDFDIVFPASYILALNSATEQSDKYVLSSDRHSITVKGFVPSSAQSTISFYLKEIVNVDQKIANGAINANDDVVYNLKYNVNGSIVPSEQLKRDDFKFNVLLDVPLAFKDATGATNDIDVNFEQKEMDFHGHFDNLEHIDEIHYIEFEHENGASRIKFETIMEKEWLKSFALKDGYALRISFPKELEICTLCSTYEGKDNKKIVYDEAEHAFYVYDLNLLAESHWDLGLKKFTLNLPVVDGVCDMDVKAYIEFVDAERNPVENFVLAGTQLESMVSTFNSLKGNKSADFVMHDSDLTIKDAEVHTETILSSLDTTSDFDLNEEVPSEIGCIEAVDFVEPVVMKFNLAVVGLEQLDTDIVLDIEALLPSFISVTPYRQSHDDMKVEIEGDMLRVNANYHPGQVDVMWVELLCNGLDFRTEDFGGKGIVPELGRDGKSYIVYSDAVVIEGDASIHGTEFHSTVLESIHDISLDIDFVMTDMEVKTFHGTYQGEIDSVNETIELDLGDDLAFLKEEGNTAQLAEPQIEVILDNSISIPVDVDLQIFGMDENGRMIPETEVNTQIRINPAGYDETSGEFTPVTTKLFITSNEALEPKVGYEKVLVPELANLLTQIPENICFNMQPRVDGSVTHHVDISKPITFTGSYAVNIPLKFDNFNLCYKETVEDIQSNIGETLEMLSNVTAKAKINVINTVPLGLKLNVTPLDADGNVIEDILVDEVMIKPGLGANILNEDGSVCNQEPQLLEFEIKCPTGDLSRLDKLDLVITAATNHVAGSVGINAFQGIKLYDVVVEVTGDFETDFND